MGKFVFAALLMTTFLPLESFASLVNKGLYFAGEDYATFHIGIQSPELEGEMAFAATIRIDAKLKTSNTILSREHEEEKFYFGVNSQGALELMINGNYYEGIGGGSDYDLLDGACHHVAVSLNYDEIFFYVDGAQVNSQLTEQNHVLPEIDYFWIGNYLPKLRDHVFPGLIDDVRIWRTHRTSSDILNNLTNIDINPSNISKLFASSDFQTLEWGVYFDNDLKQNSNYGELGPGSNAPKHAESCGEPIEMAGFAASPVVSSASVGTTPTCPISYECNLICNGSFELGDPAIYFNTPIPGIFNPPGKFLQLNYSTNWTSSPRQVTPDLFVRNGQLLVAFPPTI